MDKQTSILAHFGGTALDILPIALIVFGFQFLALRKRLSRAPQILTGFVFVWVGLSLFLVGLDRALFPLGTLMAEQLITEDFLPELAGSDTRGWSDYYWIYLFAFSIGAATTIAEPALIAVSIKAHEVSAGRIDPFRLRMAVAFGMALGITLGTFRIITGLPLSGFILGAYAIVIVQALTTPRYIVPLAFDTGGVTTSTITVPIIAALGIGLATAIPGRDPLLDGFGMIALACLFPLITVMGYAQLGQWFGKRLEHAESDPENRG
ncbi:DUF1538 domain-containing protein [Marinobacter sp. ATCH36]|uniref:DUF1538 domain-containing protein n=1 Tax=Marinobacter sp. ATCH36 TaxID=2945106 RepID=UPI0020216560|nr:DUF1538 domain-containing protein [Marinobacter sp. ATCH36]MCL7943241.1 DUF1538 domain-containing protein [Marinobacter sp. ATCH36]